MATSVPQTIIDGLNKVAADEDAVSAALDAQGKAVADLATAQHAKDVADQAVSSAAQTLQGDKTAVLNLIDSTFPVPVLPAPPPSPAPLPAA